MRSGISTSYFKTVPKKITLRERANLYKKLNYWHLVPILKIISKGRYRNQAEFLIKSKLLEGKKFGSFYRYEIKRNEAFFGVSPDAGESILNYHRGKLGKDHKNNTEDIIHSIATIEAMIKTGFCVKY